MEYTMKYKLFCTVTMKSYDVEAISEFDARKKIVHYLVLTYFAKNGNQTEISKGV